MRFSKKAIAVCSIIIIIGGFVATHITPYMSIRTYIFITGHPIEAFKGNIEKNDFQYKLDKDVLDSENAVIYVIKDSNLKDKETENVISNYKVTKTGFLYFTKNYGEA
ncbi:hypothetical protein [uncultured Clostridium sp.]|uniref:hypothetical protein n=1 Tax=uncultured Clostridium sp. TaxID=59620 RepID=UPI0026279C9B|nr:hypothetical protein [uncultured Clostridium sp.]